MKLRFPLDAAGRVRSDLADLPAVARILPRYVAGLGRDVALLTEHHGAGRRVDLRRVAHQLHGSGGAYGFPAITDLAAAVESAVAAGHSLADVADDVAALVDLIRHVEGYDPLTERPAAGRMAA